MSAIKEKIVDLSKTDQRYLNRAIELARLSDHKFRHGAVIVKGGRVVSYGFNTRRNNPIDSVPGTDYTYHAEHNAIRAAAREATIGGKIYIARLSRRGFPTLSRPCDICMVRIIKAGIKEIIYTTSNQPL